MLKLVVLVCLVALGAAQTPTKPNIPETFISEVNAAECVLAPGAGPLRACMNTYLYTDISLCSITESVIPLKKLRFVCFLQLHKSSYCRAWLLFAAIAKNLKAMVSRKVPVAGLVFNAPSAM